MDIKTIVVANNKFNFLQNRIITQKGKYKKQKMEKEQLVGEMNFGDKEMERLNLVWAYLKCNKTLNSCRNCFKCDVKVQDKQIWNQPY
jgi:superfamily II DNA helicase RecQ